MSSGGAAAPQFPIRFADILFARILDPNGQNPKVRRVVVLTPDSALATGAPIVVAGVTTSATYTCTVRATNGRGAGLASAPSLPVIVGASVLKGARLATREGPPGVGAGMAAGAAAAFSSTLVSMRLIAMLERSRSLLPYVAYRTALATTALLALRRRAAARGAIVAASPNGDRPSAPVPAAVE